MLAFGGQACHNACNVSLGALYGLLAEFRTSATLVGFHVFALMHLFAQIHSIIFIIIHMQKYQQAHWLRARQLIKSKQCRKLKLSVKS